MPVVYTFNHRLLLYIKNLVSIDLSFLAETLAIHHRP